MIASSVILILSAAAAVLLAVLRLRGHRQFHHLFSVSILVLASLLFVFFDDVSWLLPAQTIDSARLTVMALWWFCLAFAANATLKHYFLALLRFVE